ncbi:AAA domain-containing protein [Mesorhizobium sp. NBSH29]|uniref:AAA family ATPase n=1 Tax=Mesorhizobium sp. NBSH29 TaxID=2654249 RepID=UPI00189664FC|nr:AAA family ATPase [Mesorhizobium sp. NBSH29]QPC87120.1 AAA domain-containing protein [Mesorhizobium sp. NBSH29]
MEMNLTDARALFSIYFDGDTPTMMWSPPGVGKSSLVKQFCIERKIGMIDFRASTRDAVALMGIPNVEGDTTKWKVPDEFPQVERDGESGVLHLDEINVASPSMQAACYGLVLDRRVGEYVLPKGWRVAGSGNRQSDRAAAQRMPSALANRFAHIDIVPHLETSVNHFNDIGLDPMLTAFLRFRPGLLHNMENPELRSFPTPRSWEQAAKYIALPSADRRGAIAGIVGEGAGAELEGFINVYKNLPSLDLVLANPNSAPVPSEPSARFAISVGLGRKVNAKTFDAGMAYISRLPREFEIMFAVDAVRRDPGLSHTKTFTDWAVRNQDVTLG